MKRIVLDWDFKFTDEQLTHLKAVGQVEELSTVSTDDEWVIAVKDYDVICTWNCDDDYIANWCF